MVPPDVISLLLATFDLDARPWAISAFSSFVVWNWWHTPC